MRTLLLCLTLGLASPALANSMEDTLCGTSPVLVAHMATSQKLCLSFALGLAGFPDAALSEAKAVLTPENLATMASLTGIWLASQGIPGVGEAVDAALLAVGLVLLTAQLADLTQAIWEFARLTTHAQSKDDLRAAGAHLSRALALVGVNVVTAILTHKVATRLKRQPPAQPSLKPATPPGTPDAPAVPPTPETSARVPVVRASKVPRLQAFREWLATVKTREVTSSEPAFKYQVAKAGKKEYLVKGGGEEVWADGVRESDVHLLEAKFIRTPESSPYIEGSSCIEIVRASARDQEVSQFRRYAAVLRDPQNPFVGLEVITNDARAVPYFEVLMRLFAIPGRVVVEP